MRVTTGNLIDMAFNDEFDAIVQGCNCFCRMENGLAKEIRDRCPEAAAIDRETPSGDRTKLGTYSAARIDRGSVSFTVINAYIQFERRRSEGEDLLLPGA